MDVKDFLDARAATRVKFRAKADISEDRREEEAPIRQQCLQKRSLLRFGKTEGMKVTELTEGKLRRCRNDGYDTDDTKTTFVAIMLRQTII